MSEHKFHLSRILVAIIIVLYLTLCLQGAGQNQLKAPIGTIEKNRGKVPETRCTTLQLSSNLYHDARIVHDVAAFRFNQVLKEPNQIWLVMQIIPDSVSGGSVSKGLYTKKDTGEVVRERRGHIVIRISGFWKLVAALTKAPDQRNGRYEWEEPPNLWPRKTSIKDIYTIIRNGEGGSIICRYNPKAKGAEQFTSVCLIPRQWEPYVKPTLTYLEKNLERLQQESPKVINELRVLLDHKNPLVAVTACNLLAERNGLDQDFARSPLSEAKGYQQAIFTYLLLTHPLRMKQDQRFEEMSRVIESADKSDRLAGVALGIFASFFQDQLPPLSEREANLKLLDRLDKKQLKFVRRTESDKYIISILEICQIRQKARVPNKDKRYRE
ncbi:MAG: hypothetical protein ACYSW7_08255 [Planctomycetota bacterium]